MWFPWQVGRTWGQTPVSSRSELRIAQNGNGLIWRVWCAILRASGSCTSQSKSKRSAYGAPVSKTSAGCVIDTRHRGIEKAVGKNVKKADMLSVLISATTYTWVQLTLALEKKTLDGDTRDLGSGLSSTLSRWLYLSILSFFFPPPNNGNSLMPPTLLSLCHHLQMMILQLCKIKLVLVGIWIQSQLSKPVVFLLCCITFQC